MAIQSVTKPMALDETLQSTNTALGGVAKDTTLQSTNGKMDSVINKLQGIIDALGVDTSVYKAAGNKACAELIPALLVASNLGNVYNITDSGTTTSDFVEGAGKEIHVGDNVAIVDIGTGGTNIYKFDLLAGMVDLSNYVQKEAGKGLSSNDYTTAEKNKLADISANAKKVESSTTNGNIKIDGTETQVYDDSEIQGKLTTDTSEAEGNPINFSTKSAQNAVSTIIDLEPIQDLHGYDKPWVGGAGKNKLITDVATIKAWNVNGTWSGNTYTPTGKSITFTIMTDSDNNVIGIKVNGTNDNAVTDFNIYQDNENSCPFNGYILNGCSNGSVSTYDLRVSDITSGANATYGSDTTIALSDTGKWRCCIFVRANAVLSNVMFYPMIRLSTETDPTFAPYTNLCPISGRTEIGIGGCGKNLFNPDAFVQGLLNVNTGDIGASNSWITSDYVELQGAVAVQGWKDGTESNFCVRFCEYDSDKKILKNTSNINISDVVSYSQTITLNSNTRYIRASFGFNNKATTVSAFFATNRIMLELGSRATTYSPYTKSTDLTISLGQEVYGGTLNLETGELRVEKGICKVSDLTWSVQENAQYGKFKSSGLASKIYKTTTEAIAISEYYQSKSDQAAILYNDQIYTNGTGEVKIRDSRYIDDADATAWVAACGNCKIVYRLDDSAKYTLHLTPHQISLLKGVNNISVSDDYSEITLTYRSGEVATLGDLKEAIDNLPSGGDYHEYSTEEKVVGKWTDGKLIYEKTINNASVTRSSWTNIAHNISNIDTKIAITGMLIRTSDGWTVNLTYYENGASVSAVFGDTNVSIFPNVSTGNYIANVILQYTKST